MSQTKKDIEEILDRLKLECESLEDKFNKSTRFDDIIFYSNILSNKKSDIKYYENLIGYNVN